MFGMPQKRTDPAPDPAVLYYTKEDEHGRTEVATIRSIMKHKNGNWRAMFHRPGQGQEIINQATSPLKEWEPIYAITPKVLEELVEKVAQRVVAKLNEQGASVAKITAAGMNVVVQKTLENAMDAATEAISAPEPKVDSGILTCAGCGKEYRRPKSFKKHRVLCKG